MPIINSTYQADAPDAMGRYQVVERHIDHIGKEHMVTYTCEPTWSPEEIMTARAMKLGTEIDRREAQDAEANNFQVPWTHREFWQRVTPEEFADCLEFSKTDSVAAYFWEVMHTDGPIYPGNALLVQGLTYFEQAGKLAAGRANEIAGVS